MSPMLRVKAFTAENKPSITTRTTTFRSDRESDYSDSDSDSDTELPYLLSPSTSPPSSPSTPSSASPTNSDFDSDSELPWRLPDSSEAESVSEAFSSLLLSSTPTHESTSFLDLGLDRENDYSSYSTSSTSELPYLSPKTRARSLSESSLYESETESNYSASDADDAADSYRADADTDIDTLTDTDRRTAEYPTRYTATGTTGRRNRSSSYFASYYFGQTHLHHVGDGDDGLPSRIPPYASETLPHSGPRL